MFIKPKKYLNKFATQKGFTLIEILVVIAIIGILTSISIFALNNARKQGRDGRRKSDLETIRSALELYKADCNVYPNSPLPSAGSQLTGNTPPCTVGASNIYLKSRPAEAITGNDYKYVPSPAGCSVTGTCTNYLLWTYLEDAPASVPSYCTGAPSCGTSGMCNYCVTNP